MECFLSSAPIILIIAMTAMLSSSLALSKLRISTAICTAVNVCSAATIAITAMVQLFHIGMNYSGVTFKYGGFAFHKCGYASVFIAFIAVVYVIGWLYSYRFFDQKGDKNAIQYASYGTLILYGFFAFCCSLNMNMLILCYLTTIVVGVMFVTTPDNNQLLRIKQASRSDLWVCVVQNCIAATVLLVPACFYAIKRYGSTSFAAGPINLGIDNGEIIIASIILIAIVLGLCHTCILPFWMLKLEGVSPFKAIIAQCVLVNIGIAVLMKICVCYFGMQNIATMMASNTNIIRIFAMIIGSFAAFFAIIALVSKSSFRTVTYSTASQTSYIVIGVLLGTKKALLGAITFAACHAIAKTVLLVIVHFIYRVKNADLNKAMLILRTKGNLGIVYGIMGLSIAGVPPLVGFYGKYDIFMEAMATKMYFCAGVIAFGSIINILYIFPTILSVYNKSISIKSIFQNRVDLINGSVYKKDGRGVRALMTSVWLGCILIIAFSSYFTIVRLFLKG